MSSCDEILFRLLYFVKDVGISVQDLPITMIREPGLPIQLPSLMPSNFLRCLTTKVGKEQLTEVHSIIYRCRSPGVFFLDAHVTRQLLAPTKFVISTGQPMTILRSS